MRIVKTLVAFALLLAVVACEGTQSQEPPTLEASVVPRATDTPVPPTPTAEQPTAVPTDTPIPTPRPLGEGECIGWYETPSFVDRAVCVEGKADDLRDIDRFGSVFYLFFEPSYVDDRTQHQFGLFYGWLSASDVFDPMPADGLYSFLVGKCVRLHGAIEETTGRGGIGTAYRMYIDTPEQLEIIECSECQVPDACGF